MSNSTSNLTSTPASRFELQFKSKAEADQVASAFLSTLPALPSAEYTGDVVLISGANKGIGFEVARRLAAKGLKVLLGCRDEERGKEAQNKLLQQFQDKSVSVQFVQLDVESEKSIAAAVERVKELHGKLDVLINNAGIAAEFAQPSQVDGAALRKTFETNVFGPMLLTKAFLPLLEKSSHGRIVNVSSGVGSHLAHRFPDGAYLQINAAAYCVSKTALNLYTVLLANELLAKKSNIRVNAVDPGYTATDLNNNSGPQTLEEGTQAVVASSLFPPHGPTGAFLNRFGYVAW